MDLNNYRSVYFLAKIKDLKSPLNIGDCNCPSDCEAVIYNQEISQALLKEQSILMTYLESEGNVLRNLKSNISKIQKYLNDFDMNVDSVQEYMLNKKLLKKLIARHDGIYDSTSLLHFYFKEPGIVHYKHEEMFGVMDLIGKIQSMCSIFL